MSDPGMLAALEALSAAIAKACGEAKRINDAELFYQLRRLGWTVVDLLAGQARNEVAS